MKCPDCGGTLGLPSMMDGHMHCLECDHVWDGEWLCRFTAALAASRRALTMAWEGCSLDATSEDMRLAKRAIKAARTAMDKAQGRAKP